MADLRGSASSPTRRGLHRAAFDVGINFFDTANVYGRGAAESVLGRGPGAASTASSYVLATKVYFPMSARDRGLSAAQIHKQIDASLERLRTDYVDLYQCHRYDDDTPLEETMEALTEVVRRARPATSASASGRPTGSRPRSTWPARVCPPGHTPRIAPTIDRFVSSQPQYSMLWRAPEAEVFPLCERNGISQIVWSPLAQGVLTGKYRPGAPPPAGLARDVEQDEPVHQAVAAPTTMLEAVAAAAAGGRRRRV